MATQASYNKPDVTVRQQLTTVSVALARPDLVPVIVGPAYRIKRDSSVGAYDSTSTAYSYPDKESTDTVDVSSVIVKAVKGSLTHTLPDSDYTADATSVTLDADITVERDLDDATGSTGDSTALELVFTDLNATFITWGVEDTDKLVVLSGSDSGTHGIASVDSETQLTLDSTLGFTSPNLDYSITKVDAIGGGLGATVLISYRALRSDLSLGTIESPDDASAVFGIYNTPDNPLGYGISLVLANTLAQVKYLPTDGTTLSHFQTALDTLESHEAYIIIPLSQLTTVVGIAKTHVENMSAWAEKKERISATNIPLSLRSVRLETSDATITSGSGDIYIVSRPGAQFLSNGVANGDRFYLSSLDEYESAPAIYYVVREVTSEDAIKIESSTDITGVESVVTIASQDFTRLRQAQHIRDFASAVESKRVILSWPDEVEVEPDGTTYTVPGYYLNCALAGAVSSLPAQQGLTNLSIAGIKNLKHSNLGYFTESQLDTMASGGVFIFTQSTQDAVPQVRHQLTTHMGAIEYRETSIVKNVDFIAKYLRARVKPFIGMWNITEFFVSTLELTIQSAFEALKETDGASGPNIISATIVSIEQNATQPDRVDIVVDLTIPYPANDVRITLRI